MALPANSQQTQREHTAATRSQTQKTDKANQDATVADETSGASEGAQPARAMRANAPSGSNNGSGKGKQAPLSYGPTLHPRQPHAADPARKDPAEVRDEADSLAREGSPQSAPQAAAQSPQQAQQLKEQSQNPRPAQRRHQAWQSVGPLSPRPPRAEESAAIGSGAVPIPAPAQAPQPVVPSSRALNCVGGACTDAAGGSYNLGPTGAGVSSGGRLCSSSGTTVQCF
jgi:hypothetical protein